MTRVIQTARHWHQFEHYRPGLSSTSSGIASSPGCPYLFLTDTGKIFRIDPDNGDAIFSTGQCRPAIYEVRMSTTLVVTVGLLSVKAKTVHGKWHPYWWRRTSRPPILMYNVALVFPEPVSVQRHQLSVAQRQRQCFNTTAVKRIITQSRLYPRALQSTVYRFTVSFEYDLHSWLVPNSSSFTYYIAHGRSMDICTLLIWHTIRVFGSHK